MDYYEYLSNNWGISPYIYELVEKCESEISESLKKYDCLCQFNQTKVLRAFQKEKIGQRHFAPSTGYGYDDIGREMLDKVFAHSLGYEDAIVRPSFASGTHAIATTLFAILRPGDEMLSISGKPYDTLEETIGIREGANGSLKEYGIGYTQVDLRENEIDIDNAIKAIKPCTKLVYIQRSRGYSWRNALTVTQINTALKAIKKVRSDIVTLVDNCYGEFTECYEPDSDLIAGSLIKNPGGGLAPSGGYIAGKRELIDIVGQRVTSPGIGREVGSYAAGYLQFFEGFFLAPRTVADCLKSSELFAKVYSELGYDVLPIPGTCRSDIIQSICFNDADRLLKFCQAIQAASPVDSNVVPEPWGMPGYDNSIVMASGSFIQGSSIELSADAPVIAPYIAYIQGGLTYQHIKFSIYYSAECITKV